MADCAKRTASSVSPLPMAAWAWVRRDSTVTGGAGGAGLGALCGAAQTGFSTGAATSRRAARRGIVREVMGRPYGISAGLDHVSFAAQSSDSHEACAIKAVGAGGGRAGAEAPGQAGGGILTPLFRQIQRRKAGMAALEGGQPVLVLDRQDGTGGIEQPPAGADQRGGLVQQPVLGLGQCRQPAGGQPPALFGLAPPGPRAAAGRV